MVFERFFNGFHGLFRVFYADAFDRGKNDVHNLVSLLHNATDESEKS
jgi:hypothetical protein